MRSIITFLASISIVTSISSQELDSFPIGKIRPHHYGGENWVERGVVTNFVNCMLFRPKSPCKMCKSKRFQRLYYRYPLRRVLEREAEDINSLGNTLKAIVKSL